MEAKSLELGYERKEGLRLEKMGRGACLVKKTA